MTRTTGERIRGKCLVTPAQSRPGGGRAGGKTNTAARIRRKCRDLADLLVRKSRSYGDSLLHPLGIFARGDPEQLIRCRLDDKLSRLRHAPGAFGEDEIWDMLGYLHHCRVMVQRNGITRVRPAFRAAWTAQFEFLCLLPEYIRPEDLHDALSQAGRLIGVGDFRPTYGRFQVTSFGLSLGH